VVGLPAHFLGKQGGSNATLLPESVLLTFPLRIQYFKWKSSILAGEMAQFTKANFLLTINESKNIRLS
jgi:hypothetical protein